MTIYVVMGTTGEYSDRTEWAVAAFRDKAEAEQRIVSATRRANELQVTRVSRYHIEKGANEFDPNMSMDYTGTSYFYYEVELVDANQVAA